MQRTIRVGSAHRFDHQMDRLSRPEAAGREIEALEDVEHLDQGDTA